MFKEQNKELHLDISNHQYTLTTPSKYESDFFLETASWEILDNEAKVVLISFKYLKKTLLASFLQGIKKERLGIHYDNQKKGGPLPRRF